MQRRWYKRCGQYISDEGYDAIEVQNMGEEEVIEHNEKKKKRRKLFEERWAELI